MGVQNVLVHFCAYGAGFRTPTFLLASDNQHLAQTAERCTGSLRCCSYTLQAHTKLRGRAVNDRFMTQHAARYPRGFARFVAHAVRERAVDDSLDSRPRRSLEPRPACASLCLGH